MKLAVIAPAYGTGEEAFLLVESAARVGLPVLLYGMGKVYSTHTESKLRAVLPILQDLEANGYDTVLQTDAHDALFVHGERRIIEGYRHYASPDILLSAETNCYPDASLSVEYDLVDSIDSPYRYVCAGGWMGNIRLLRQAIPQILDQAPHEENDQLLWTLAYLRLYDLDIALDHERKVFQTAAGALDLSIDASVIHFNGRSPGREELWRKVCGANR